MIHELDCLAHYRNFCICPEIRAARRAREEAAHEPECPKSDQPDWDLAVVECICDELLGAYRRGFNDHARGVIIGKELYGTAKPISESDPLPYSPAGPWPALEAWNQHGKGENP